MRMNRAVIAALCVASLVVASAVYADPQIPGGTEGVAVKFSDWTTLVRNGQPVTSGLPQVGDEGRSLFYATSMLPNPPKLDVTPNGFPFWTASAAEEITGINTDFVIPGGPSGKFWEYQVGTGYVNTGSSGVISRGGGQAPDTYYVPGARYGGKFEIWVDSSPDFFSPAGGAPTVPQQGPLAWVTNGSGTDNYPGATALANDGVSTDPDVSLYISGKFVPLFVDFNGDLYRDPGEMDQGIWDPSGDDTIDPKTGLMIDPSGDDVSAVEIGQGVLPGQGGNTHAWIDAEAGSLLDYVYEDHMDLSGNDADYDMYFESTIRPGADNWPNNSSDPVIFAVVPEPVTVSLLASVMFGTVAATRRRRKK